MRNFPNWLDAFVSYASYGEAPPKFYWWTGISTIAGALRRHVWIDQAYFKWLPNLYIILVAPPGIVQKSTTASLGMNLLRRVPGINFGPDAITWQALVKNFASFQESVQLPSGLHIPMSAMTIESSEFGNLISPQDREMVDLLVSLWDGRSTFTKITKGSGCDVIENPWLNIIAGTTPAWIAGNFPEYMIGGGFTSRCLFVYAQEKHRYVAYPGLAVPKDILEAEARLISDLEHISINLVGEYGMTREAITWGEAWYEQHYKSKPKGLDDSRFGGYIARKQTMIHKVGMILAAAKRDTLALTREDLEEANLAVTDLEADMPLVFSLIGRSDMSLQTDRCLNYIKLCGSIEYAKAYRYIHHYFPEAKDFESILAGAIKAGYIKIEVRESKTFIVALEPLLKEQL